MKFVTAAAAALTLTVAGLAASAASATDYLPVGPQENVLEATVLGGGWTECFSGAYGNFGPSVSGILDACGGSKLMLAGRVTGSDTLLLLAQADRADVLFDEGGNVYGEHLANGSEWYFSNSYSWGFAPAGDAVYRVSCDASGVFNGDMSGYDQRLCWHTGSDQMNGGWRVGANIWLNGSQDFQKVVYSFEGGRGVPEPAAWALMIGGFGLAGAALRRKAAVAA
jgi:hypothetical protein